MWARIESGEVVEIINFDPEGRFHPSLEWVECDYAEQGWRLVDGDVVPPAPRPPEEVKEELIAGILAERARRLASGFDYDFGDERGVHHIGTTEDDKKGWREAHDWAAAMTGLGDTVSTLLITTETGPAHVTAREWHAIVAHGATVQQPIWQASFILQAMETIPEDYADDEYWLT